MTIAHISLGNIVDIMAALITILLIVRGLTCGATVEIARLLGFFGGVYAGTLLFPKIYTAMAVMRNGASITAIALSAFVLTLILAVAIGFLTRYAGVRILQIVIFQPADAILGMAAGIVYASVIMAVICAFGMLMPFHPVQQIFTEQSMVGRIICPWLRVRMGIV